MHKIENIAFGWEFNNIGVPNNIETTCNNIIQDRLLPKIEQQLDAWSFRNPKLKCIIPEIKINILCTDFSVATIEHLLLRQFKYILEEKTKNAKKNTNENNAATLILESPTVEDLLLQYLQKGYVTHVIEAKEIKEWMANSNTIDPDFIANIVQLIAENSVVSKRFITLFSNMEAATKMLFKDTSFYKEANFVAQLLEEITQTVFPKKNMKSQIEIWKTVLISSTSLDRCIKTLQTIFQPLVSFQHHTSQTIFSLSALVLQAKCQFTTKRKLNLAIFVHEIFKVSNNNLEEITEHTMKTKDSSLPNNKEQIEKNSDKKNNQNDTTTQKVSKASSIKKSVEDTSSNSRDISEKQLKNLKEQTNTSSKKELHIEATHHEKEVLETTIISDNIGLFILHPFLKEFFIEANILKGKKIIDPNKGIQLLHYLATGTDECKDISVLTEKILLGIPIHQPIYIETPLSAEEKELCDTLLKAVLKHWSVLEKSGIDTLRAMFLVREGSILIKEKSIRIEAQHLAQDVLLKKLPWGLGMILFPWSTRIYQINWKS